VEPWRRNLYTLWAAQFLAQVGLSLVVPFMPLYIGTLGVGGLAAVERWSGVLFAAPFLAMTVAAPLWGALADRYGRKIMILRALGGIGVTNLVTAFVTNVWQLLALRGTQGAVSGFVSATNALVSSSVPRDRLGAVLGVLQTSLTAGAVVGPLVGGALADLTGYRRVFIINGLMCWIAAGVVLWGVNEPARETERAARGGVRENLAHVFGSPALRTVALLLCASQIAVLEVEPMFPLYVEALGVPAAHVATISGLLFSATGIASIFGAPIWGRMADRGKHDRVVQLVLWGACIAYAL
jgi:DHA1 family multidrug resistance protein-like MFS transporter